MGGRTEERRRQTRTSKGIKESRERGETEKGGREVE